MEQKAFGIFKNEVFPLLEYDIKEKTGKCWLECL